MSRQQVQPSIVPVLSSGRHRTPRSGACFMEFASFLAGEKWSDHPKCTHGGLASLARMVNDCIADDERARLAPLIPSVIGLTTDDPRLDPIIAVHAAAAAIPIAAEERQRSLAIGAIVCSTHLEQFGGLPVDVTSELTEAFRAAPDAERWARAFVYRYTRRMPRDVTARHAQAIVQGAVEGIALACVDDNDDRLVALLTSSIDLTRRFIDGIAGAPAVLPPAARGRFSRRRGRAFASA